MGIYETSTSIRTEIKKYYYIYYYLGVPIIIIDTTPPPGRGRITIINNLTYRYESLVNELPRDKPCNGTISFLVFCIKFIYLIQFYNKKMSHLINSVQLFSRK